MQAEPFSSVTVPLDVEAVALNEAILGAVPLSQDIDGIVELRRLDGGQEAGLQEVVDQVPAGGSHRQFFCRGEAGRSHVLSRFTPLRRGLASGFANSRAAVDPTCGWRDR